MVAASKSRRASMWYVGDKEPHGTKSSHIILPHFLHGRTGKLLDKSRTVAVFRIPAGTPMRAIYDLHDRIDVGQVLRPLSTNGI